ncbi:unnamed protein product, partial [Rotaria sp. Silwood2]
TDHQLSKLSRAAVTVGLELLKRKLTGYWKDDKKK